MIFQNMPIDMGPEASLYPPAALPALKPSLNVRNSVVLLTTKQLKYFDLVGIFLLLELKAAPHPGICDKNW
jgi:hypothetical protein